MTPLQIELWNDAIWWLDIDAEYYPISPEMDNIRNEYGWHPIRDYEPEAWFNLLLIEVLK